MFQLASAQTTTSAGSSQPKTTSRSEYHGVTPSYTYKGKWYGFITCSKMMRQGYNSKPDDIRKCVAGGGRYILYNVVASRLDFSDQVKPAPFAGQQVWIVGTLTSQSYSGGPTSDPALDGFYAGGDRPATRFNEVKIISITPTTHDDAYTHYGGVSSDLGSRVADSAQ